MVIVCDEAHLLSGPELEELRFLTNSEMDSSSSFALILVGQPSLRQRLKLGTNSALDQRVSLRYALTSMTKSETHEYVSHHVKLAGRTDALFSDDAISLIHQVSRGLPRSINNYARQALVAAYANKSAIVDEKSVRHAVAEADSE